MTTPNTDGTLAATPSTPATPAATPATPNPNPTPDPRIKELSDEAASWRVKLRGAEDQVATLKKEIDALKTPAATGDERAQVAELKRKVTELEGKGTEFETKWKQAQEKANTETLKSAISQAIAGTTNVPYAMRLAQASATVDADGAAVFNVTNEKGEAIKVPVTAENARKYGVIPPEFIPADGVGGAGSQSRGTEIGGGFDFQRCLKDQEYFNKHEKEFWAAYPKAIRG
jgi:hypothetical protein